MKKMLIWSLIIIIIVNMAGVFALPNDEGTFADGIWIGTLRLLSQIWLPLIFIFGAIILVMAIVLFFRVIMGMISGGRK